MIIIFIVFWTLIFISIHSYIFYPISIRIISGFFPIKKIKSVELKGISIVISAFNEEKVIRNRVLNISECIYDFNKIEVLIGSDCSSDRTNEILNNLKQEFTWLKVFIFNTRRGKAGVLNDLVEKAVNEIIIFSDANTIFDKNALVLLAEEFTSDSIGGVSGRLILTEPDSEFNKSVEEKTYWDYETYIKKYEGKCGILIGANGGIFAIRKSLYNRIPMDKAITDDLYITLTILKKNYKFIYKYEASAYEEFPKEIFVEFKRKIRFGSTNFETLRQFKSLLLSKNTLLSYAFWSHKVIRWFLPGILLLIYVLNFLLLSSGICYLLLFLLFNLFILSGVIGGVLSKLRIQIRIFSIPFFFHDDKYSINAGIY